MCDILPSGAVRSSAPSFSAATATAPEFAALVGIICSKGMILSLDADVSNHPRDLPAPHVVNVPARAFVITCE